MTDAKATAGAADARPETADEVRARLKKSIWKAEEIAYADAPTLVAVEARLAAAQAELEAAEVLAAELLQPTIEGAQGVQSITAAIRSGVGVVKAGRTIGLALAGLHAQAQKA